MSKRKSSKPPRETVGYGRPPKSTRFKKGKSGNPKGRPRGARGMSAVLHNVMRQKIPVTENGRTRRVPALEVMLRRLANDAMRNDPRALKLVFSLVDRHTEGHEAGEDEPDAAEVLKEDEEILTRYLPALSEAAS
jgi:hypothetical protein